MERILEDILRAKCRIGGAEIFEGSGIVKNLPPTVGEYNEEGLTVLLSTRGYAPSASALADSFKENGMRVKILYSGEEEMPEYARLIIGVGDDAVCAAAKAEAEALGVDLVLFPTVPDCLDVMCGYCPKQVFIDENILLNSGYEHIAAAWGALFAAKTDTFEEYFIRKVMPEEGAFSERAAAEIPDGGRLSAVLMQLISLSYKRVRRSASDVMSEILKSSAEREGRKARASGEYKFVSACLLNEFYGAYLRSPAIDVMLPCDVCGDADMLARETACDALNLLKRIDFCSVNSYFRISYILGEYRTDLIKMLADADIRSRERQWRRLYPDAGYWMKSEFTARSLMRALALAGTVADGLLGYAARTGFTDTFLKRSA